jgi:multiple sugar transport system ATP-binding protein
VGVPLTPHPSPLTNLHMADLRITGLHKYYGPVHAVKGVDLEIPAGEFTVLVGQSGCGKSTLLRTIAGLEDADQGTIEIGGEVVNDQPPRRRDIAMVFQNYALYPYMHVYDNIAFGLRARRTPKQEIDGKVKRAAQMLAIGHLLERYPRQLSGGQLQRVAIGRAIVRNARLYLFDEPLSNLDAQLRDEMRGEIKRLHQELGKTMIYVTHDQIEAMTMAERIVLLRDGRIEQQGSPLDLYERPATRYVAGFLGSPAMNFVSATLVSSGAGLAVRLADGTELALPAARAPKLAGRRDPSVVLGVRPEHMSRALSGDTRAGLARLTALIDLVQPTGARTYATFKLGGSEAVAELQAHDVSEPGTRIELAIDMNRAVLIDPSTELVIS